MTALYVTSAILLVLLVLLFTRIRISLLYKTNVQVYLRVWFIKIPLYPQKKRVRIKDFEYKRLKKKRQNDKKQVPVKKTVKKEKPPLRQQISFYMAIFRALYKKFLQYFRIDVTQIHINVATQDAAQTAILFGAVSQSVAYICEILRQHTNFHKKHCAAIAVTPDFVGEKSSADCNVTFSLAVWQIIHLGLQFAIAFLKNKSKPAADTK